MKSKFDLIRERLGRTFPCAHENADTRCGNGTIWAKGEDCGETFQQDHWDRYRESARKHQEAIDALDELEGKTTVPDITPLEQDRDNLLCYVQQIHDLTTTALNLKR